MVIDVSQSSTASATLRPEPDTSFSIVWHRTQIHLRPQHGCVLCPAVPCVCGFDGELCPQYFEHRRDYAGAELTWRETA